MKQSFQKEVDFYKQNGYTVFKGHLNEKQCDRLTETAMSTLFNMAFYVEKEKVEPTFENLILFSSHEERKRRLIKPTGIWANGKSTQPLCSPTTGLCYGSYLRPFQEEFTMTFETFEKVSACYGSENIAQIYGPMRYTVRYKGGHESFKQFGCSIVSDFHNACQDDKVITSAIVSIDEKIRAEDSGTICLIPGFHLYRHIARVFFSPVRGIFRLPLNLSNPTQLDDRFATEGISSFNAFLQELHLIRNGKMKSESRHEDYIKFELPQERVELRWTAIRLQRGDMICRSQWLPFYETECKSIIPFIALHVGYYPIPPGFQDSQPHQILINTLTNGHIMEECKSFSKIKSNTCETKMADKSPGTVFFYVPKDDEMLEFALFIQCIDFGQ